MRIAALWVLARWEGGGLDREDAWVGWVGLGGEFRGWMGWDGMNVPEWVAEMTCRFWRTEGGREDVFCCCCCCCCGRASHSCGGVAIASSGVDG